MEDKQVVVKTIKKSYDDTIKAGITWFRFISAINDISLTKRELELLSFINTRGTISSIQAKEEFCRIFETSKATISNMISKLLKKRLLIKEKNKTKINPALKVDFNNDFVVRFYINLNNLNNINDRD